MRLLSIVLTGLIFAASASVVSAANQPAAHKQKGMSKTDAFNACHDELGSNAKYIEVRDCIARKMLGRK